MQEIPKAGGETCRWRRTPNQEELPKAEGEREEPDEGSGLVLHCLLPLLAFASCFKAKNPSKNIRQPNFNWNIVHVLFFAKIPALLSFSLTHF